MYEETETLLVTASIKAGIGLLNAPLRSRKHAENALEKAIEQLKGIPAKKGLKVSTNYK